MIEPFHHLACPLDGLPLKLQQNSWSCTQGHCFDQARQGHVNLLSVQHKKSRDPGDSKDMVVARAGFLAKGYYQPMAQLASELLLAGEHNNLACLDAGCGEGYYLRFLQEMAAGYSLQLLGLDISKWAVQAAAAQNRDTRWVVGSNAHLPVLPGTLDRVMCLFGFPVYAEFARVLKPGGILLMLDPGADHLRQLRDIIYPATRLRDNPAAPTPPGFEPVQQQELVYSIELESRENIADLLAMTPHLHRAPASGRQKVAQLDSLSLTVHARLRLLRRT